MLSDLAELGVVEIGLATVSLTLLGYGIDALYVNATKHPTGKLDDVDQESIVSNLRTCITSFPLPHLPAEHTEAHEMSEHPPGPQNTGNFQTWFLHMVGVMRLTSFQPLHIL